LELVLFSFLLANRVNTDRQVALEAKSKLLVIEQEANQMLEQKVEERTQEISQQKKQLEMLAITDSLTGLYNRRGFGDHFERCFQRRSQQAPLCMVMLDIDYFKNYNDYYGHQKGDEVLESVGHLLTRQFSYSGSEAFRLGGEEFALLFHGQLSEAVDVAEQCRQAVYDLGIAHQASDIGLVTASFGVIVIDESDDLSSSEIYKLADDALYQSKRTGRNRISVWSPEEAATNESVCKVR
jgi:diguanylate cyclase